MSIGELRSILNTSRLLKLGRYGMWNALDQVVNLGVQRLAIFPLLAACMGAGAFGSFILAFTVAQMVGTTPSNGVAGYIIRDAAKYGLEDRRLLMRTMLILSILIVVPMALLIVAMTPHLGRWYGNSDFPLLLPQFAVFLVLTNAVETCLTIQRVERRFGYIVLVHFLQGIFLFSAIPLYWYGGLRGVAAAFALSNAICLVIVIGGDLKTYRARPLFSRKFACEALAVWVPFSASVFLLVSAGYLDRMLLGYWWHAEEVAVFFAAVSTAAVVAIPGSVVSSLVLSLLGGVRDVSRFSRSVLWVYAVSACVCCLLIFIMGVSIGSYILPVLYPRLAEQALPLWTMAVASFSIMSIQAAVRPFVIKFLAVKTIPRLTLLGAFGRALPLILLVPSGGRQGAVTAMLIGSAWSTALWVFVYMRGFLWSRGNPLDSSVRKGPALGEADLLEENRPAS